MHRRRILHLQAGTGNSWDWGSATCTDRSYILEALPATGATTTVTAIKLNVRSGPSLAHGIMGWLYKDQQIQLVGRNSTGTWLKVNMAPGFDGWVSAAYITANYAIASLLVVD